MMNKSGLSGALANIGASVEQLARQIDCELPNIGAEEMSEYQELLDVIQMYQQALIKKIGEVGDRVQLTDYSGKRHNERIVGLNPSILGIPDLDQIYLENDPNCPRLLNSFQEFETQSMKIRKEGEKRVLIMEAA